MHRLLLTCAIFGLEGVQGTAAAQDAAVLNDGKTFAESIAPQLPGQVVNPSGINPTAWSGSGGVPTTVPSGLGAFSTPPTSSPLYGTSGAQGALAALGSSKILACQNYVPIGDPIADQECAAVKFMHKDCIPLNSSQSQVVGAVGMVSPTGTDCTDTYGTGVSNFGFGNVVTATDPVFTVTQAAQTNTSAELPPQNCVSTSVITKPAEYETNRCNKTISTDLHLCTQELAVSFTTTNSPATPVYSCAEGTLQGTSCVRPTTSPASQTYFCPNGGTLSGTWCISALTYEASLHYTCPPDQTLHGTLCEGSASVPATIHYSCPGGVPPVGTQCETMRTQTQWIDHCLPYERSAGILLGAPQ